MELPNRFRALLVGYPKSGKSGAIVPLLKAGYRVIYNDFDGNPEVMRLAGGEYAKNLVYLPYEDKIRMTGLANDARLAGVSGEPKAYLRYMEFLEKGTYISPDGTTKEDYGPMASWGPDTFCVTDSVTELTERIWARFLNIMGRKQRRKQDWGTVVDELRNVAKFNMAMRLQCHSIWIAHFQLTGAEEMEEDDNTGKRSELIEHNNAIKAQKAELIGPRLFPKAVTKAQSENFAALFPTVLPLIVDETGKRVFDLQPKKELMVSLPASHAKLLKVLPQETGLLDIFRAVTGAH